MLHRFYQAVVDNCLVEGATSPQGWGETVKSQVLPILKHPKLEHHYGIIKGSLERFSQPISVFVVGEGNFGKSTLINALIGQGMEIAKTHFLPATWHIARYVPTQFSDRYEIYFNEQHEEAERFISTCQSSCQEIQIESGLVKVNSLSELQQILNLEETEKKQTGKQSPIWQVLQTVPQSPISNNMELIDTPGISQKRDGTVQEETIEDFYHRADIVLWMMIADKINSKETVTSLESMSRYGKPIVGVVNRADQIPENKKEIVIEQVQERFGDLLNDCVLLSAKQAFTAHQNQDKSLLNTSGLPNLYEKIDYFVVKNGRRNQAISTYNTSVKAAQEAKKILNSEADNIVSNISTYHKNMSLAREFSGKANRIVEDAGKSLSNQVKSAAQKAMNDSKNLDSEYGDVFNKQKVIESVNSQIAEAVTAVELSLQSKLEEIGDQIKINQYKEQFYSSSSTIKSCVNQASFKVRSSSMTLNVDITAIKVGFLRQIGLWFVEIAGGLGEAIDTIGDLWEDIFGDGSNYENRDKRRKKKNRERREREFNAYFFRLNQISDNCKYQFTEAVKEDLKRTTKLLELDVEECFKTAFDSEEAMQAKASKMRQDASASFIAPVVMQNISKAVKG